MWAFRQTFEDEVPLPAEGMVIGEGVSATKIDYNGNPQRGLRAIGKKGDGNRWGNGKAKPSPLTVHPIKELLKEMGQMADDLKTVLGNHDK